MTLTARVDLASAALVAAASLLATPALAAPDSAARIIARVNRMGMRAPTPYGPPVHPVFTSHTCASWSAIF